MATSTEPTAEQIQAAYDLVYNNEKAIAESLLLVADQFMESVNEIAANFPGNATQSPVGMFLMQLKNMEMMYLNNANNTRSYYGMTVPTSPGAYMPPPQP